MSMIEEQACGNCYYAKAFLGLDGKVDFTSKACKRFPPSVSLQTSQGIIVLSPRMKLDDWCGEWKSLEEQTS